MDPKKGDRVSLDAKKVGQLRRGGVVRSVTQGISGVRYQIEWDDGSQSLIAPGAGILLVEGNTASSSKKAKTVARKAATKKAKAVTKKAKAVTKKAKAVTKKTKVKAVKKAKGKRATSKAKAGRLR